MSRIVNTPVEKVNDVRLYGINKLKDDINDNYLYICNFCNKNFKVTRKNRISCKNLSSNDEQYCSFCLRHNFHHKTGKNILTVSFRAIFAYYYYSEYVSKKAIQYHEIAYMMDCHEYYGLQNPVFSYDSETFLWFIDFNKIGNSKSKAPIRDVLNTVYDIIYQTQIYKASKIEEKHLDLYYEKFKESIMDFYEKRKRPEENKMLIPTFYKIMDTTPEFNNVCKAFSKNHFYSLK